MISQATSANFINWYRKRDPNAPQVEPRAFEMLSPVKPVVPSKEPQSFEDALEELTNSPLSKNKASEPEEFDPIVPLSDKMFVQTLQRKDMTLDRARKQPSKKGAWAYLSDPDKAGSDQYRYVTEVKLDSSLKITFFEPVAPDDETAPLYARVPKLGYVPLRLSETAKAMKARSIGGQ